MASQFREIPAGNRFFEENDRSEGSLFASIIPYVLMIIVLPIAIFFSSKKAIFQDLLGYKETSAEVSSAICAVIALHVLLAAFICKAFCDPKPKAIKKD